MLHAESLSGDNQYFCEHCQVGAGAGVRGEQGRAGRASASAWPYPCAVQQ